MGLGFGGQEESSDPGFGFGMTDNTLQPNIFNIEYSC